MPSTTDQNDGSGNTLASTSSTTNDLHSLGPNAHKLDIVTTPGDANYQMVPTDRYLITTVALTANRTWTLPAASAVPSGWGITVADSAGVLPGVGANFLRTLASGSDTIDTVTSVKFLARPYSYVVLRSDGVSNWMIVGISPSEAYTASIDSHFRHQIASDFVVTVSGLVTVANGANNNVAVAQTYSRTSGNTGAFSITGFAAPVVGTEVLDGARILVENQSSFTMTLSHMNSGSVAANRIYVPGAADLVLAGQYGCASLVYDNAAGNWLVYSHLP